MENVDIKLSRPIISMWIISSTTMLKCFLLIVYEQFKQHCVNVYSKYFGKDNLDVIRNVLIMIFQQNVLMLIFFRNGT